MIILYIGQFILLCLAVFFSLVRSNFPIHMLQLEGYDNNLYRDYIKSNREKIGKIFYMPEKNPKLPLVWTDRAKRLLKTHKFVNYGFWVATVIIGQIVYKNSNLWIGLFFTTISLFLIYYFEYRILLISNAIAKPKEDRINAGFYHEAQEKIKRLKAENSLKVIGITGSFGKTSVKFITDIILKEKFRVLHTPSSFNTPMGLSKVINNELNDSHQIFIAELGAKVPGEIKEVAELVMPDMGVITAIGPTHMQFFKTIENIQKTKYELIEALPQDGLAIFNCDNEFLKPLADKTKLKTYRYGMEDTEKLDIYAKDIEVFEKGSKFTLVIRGKGEINCQTKLLGAHNISNILAGVSFAHLLGMTLEEIQRGIEKVEGVEHRLNIIDGGRGVIVIDDAFNSNPVGFRAALDVISQFKNGNKIIITPGMVELGEMEEEENYKIGKEMAKNIDYAILVGKKRTEPIKKGLIENKFKEENIFSVSSLDEATKILGNLTRQGDVVLFENDLPDNYDEEWFDVKCRSFFWWKIMWAWSFSNNGSTNYRKYG